MSWVSFMEYKLRNVYLLLTIILFICLQLFFLNHFGIKTDLESAKYIYNSDLFKNTGQLYAPSFTLYFTQIFGITIFKAMGLGLAGMVAFQMLISLTATLYLFITLEKIWGSRTAFLSVILFLLNNFFQNYTVFLQTESLFFSLVTLIFSYICYPRKWEINHYLTLILMSIILGFTRPSGILFFPAIMLFIVNNYGFRKQAKITLLIAGFVVFFILLNTLLSLGGDLNFAIPFQEQMIICGVPEVHQDLTMAENMNSIKGLFSYITNYPINFITLAVKKTISFVIPYREYYSVLHNIYLVALFIILYFFTLFGIKQWLAKSKLLFFTLMLAPLLVWISVVFSCDDWHNRFLLSIYPHFIFLGSAGINRLLKNLRQE